MFDINKIISDARELGIGVKTDVPDGEKGLFYKDENGKLIEWDYKNDFSNQEDDLENYLDNLKHLTSNIDNTHFYENDNSRQEVSGENSDLVGAA